MIRVGLIGARGYVGGELIRLLDGHHDLELSYASSRALAGQAINRVIPGVQQTLNFEQLEPSQVASRDADVVVLAMPNGLAAPFVETLSSDTVVIDLSADYRFDDDWYYGLPELTRAHAPNQKRISNPGCYATAMQLALAPLQDVLNAPPACFGVSGYSGAGTKPSPNNDPKVLADNLVPYKSIGHIHEREVTRQLKHPVNFMPHVAPFFRGICMTVNASLSTAITADELNDRYAASYQQEPMISLSQNPPHLSAIAGKPGAVIGGLAISDDGRRAVVHCTLDNLLKGAATQALQNINLACGLSEIEGISFG